MTVFQNVEMWLVIVEACFFGVLVIVHVISNFYNARCTCKLCKLARQIFPSSDTNVSQTSASATPDFMSLDDDVKAQLIGNFLNWLEDQEEE